MSHPVCWNALTDWKPVDVNWVRIAVSKDDLQRFTRRSNLRGFVQCLGFLAFITASGAAAWWAFSQQRWVLMAAALYIHGIFYDHIGESFHELGHGTVFSTRRLNDLFLKVFGLLYWPANPYLYRLSHRCHHRYTLFQGSDGEDTPNYVELNPKWFWDMFIGSLFQVRSLLINLACLLTLKPTIKYWRVPKGYRYDTWVQFLVKNASPQDRRQLYRFAVLTLIVQVLFVGVCLYFGQWFLIVLVTLAPFYGAGFHNYLCGVHQHAACEPNHPDFRVSAGDALLDPISSFLHWHMEYHIEHHMYAAVPCYNLKKFSRFVADQLPGKEYALPRLLKLHRICKEKYGSRQYWYDHFGMYRGM